MIVVQPNTSAEQLFRIRVRETSSLFPLTCSISHGNSDRWTAATTTCSVADYDNNDFLNLSASISIPYGEIASIQVFQVSASNNTWRELFRGELMATTQSATIRTSEPFTSYTGSKTEYLIF